MKKNKKIFGVQIYTVIFYLLLQKLCQIVDNCIDRFKYILNNRKNIIFRIIYIYIIV